MSFTILCVQRYFVLIDYMKTSEKSGTNLRSLNRRPKKGAGAAGGKFICILALVKALAGEKKR